MNTLRIAAVFLAVTLLSITTAEAKRSHRHYNNIQHRVIRDVTPAFAGTTQISARRHSYRHSSVRGGSCDGFHRCRCGVTAARLHGLPLNYQGKNLKLAAAWYDFPRTTCHAGAVGIPHAHHVYTVVQCNGDGTAVVSDDAGTYTRRVAGNTFVNPGGGEAVTHIATHHRSTRTYAARTHHRRQYQQVAYMQSPMPVRDMARVGW